MAARNKCLNQSDGHCREQSSKKDIGGNNEDGARLAHASQIDEGDRGAGSRDRSNVCGLQRWYGGDKRPYAGGDSHRGGKNVVDHQGGCSEQPGKFSQVFPSHRVGAAAVWVSGNGLPIRKVNDRPAG